MEAFIFLFAKCRLCLERPGVINLFGSGNEDLPEDVYLCTGLRVHPSDNFPQKICNECIGIIHEAKKLRVRAFKNDTHLRTLFMVDGVKKDNSAPETVNSKQEDSINSNICKSEETNNQSNVNDTSDMKTSPFKNISVRKDLFEASPVKIISRKRPSLNSTEEQLDDINSCKRIQVDENTVLFECCICYKTYDRWKKLYLHHRLHKKSEVCPLEACGKKFSTKGDLEKHIRIHTGEKPFKCNQCERSFSQRVTLKVHRERVHCVLLV